VAGKTQHRLEKLFSPPSSRADINHVVQHLSRPGNIKLYDSSAEKFEVVRALPVPLTTGSWINSKYVGGLQLRCYDDGVRFQTTFRKKLLASTGGVVDLTCTIPAEGASLCSHKFYIVEHPEFDILFGNNIGP
jgi:hypothetical protein